MNIMNHLTLNLILIVFPFLIYFIYNCYREIRMEKYNHLLFDVALVSSLYLCLKFGQIKENIFALLLCNLPIILAYLKKETKTAIFLSLIVASYTIIILNHNILLTPLKLISFLIIYLLGRKKKINNNTFIIIIVIIQGFFLSFYCFTTMKENNIFKITELFIMMLLFFILPFILLYLFQLADRITNLYQTALEFEKDKQLKNSLFKITHEVKNPIAVCKGYLDMLDTNNKEQIKNYIPIMKEEITRCLDIMNDFMEFSKIKIEKEIIDINMLLEDIDKEFKLFTNNKKITFTTHILNDEIYIEGDYNRLKQVFINLIKNSLEAIKEKGNIQINTHILKGQYYIEITDNGIGMDEETISHITEMFYTTKSKGSGLGVSLSNEIIKAHNGSINYYSKKGYGTKVVVKIPMIMI